MRIPDSFSNRKSKVFPSGKTWQLYLIKPIDYSKLTGIRHTNHFKLSLPTNRVATQTNFYKSDRFALLRTPLRRLRADSIPCLCWRTRGCHGSCRLSFRINHRVSLINSDRRIVHSVIQYWIAHASPWSSNPGLCESSVALRIPYSSYGFSNHLKPLRPELGNQNISLRKSLGKASEITCTAYTMQNDMWALMWPLSKTTLLHCAIPQAKAADLVPLWCIGIIWNHILHLLHPLKVKWHKFKGLKPWP